MNTQKIKFTVNNEQKEIEVKGVYPYLINPSAGKVVLRIAASEEDATFDDLQALKNNESGIIELYERVANPETGELSDSYELKDTYTDYDSGEVHIDYKDGQYQAEVTRVDGMVKQLRQLRADLDYMAAMADIPLEN